MRFFLVYLWRKIKLIYLKRNKIFLKKNVLFNKNTIIEDNVLINSYCHLYNSFIGRGTYIGNSSILNHSYIGRFCSIGSDIRVVLGNHPVNTWISTHPAFFSNKKQSGFSFVKEDRWNGKKTIDKTKYECYIGNDVWIGDKVIILSGLKILDGCIIAAGSVMTKNTEPYCIYAGVPARKIGQRFDNNDIKKLIELKWWESSIEKLKENAHLFETIENYDKLKDILK